MVVLAPLAWAQLPQHPLPVAGAAIARARTPQLVDAVDFGSKMFGEGEVFGISLFLYASMMAAKRLFTALPSASSSWEQAEKRAQQAVAMERQQSYGYSGEWLSELPGDDGFAIDFTHEGMQCIEVKKDGKLQWVCV